MCDLLEVTCAIASVASRSGSSRITLVLTATTEEARNKCLARFDNISGKYAHN